MEPASSWVEVESCGTCDSVNARVVRQISDVPVVQCERCGTLRASKVLSPEEVYVEGYHKGEGDLHPFDYTAPLSIEHERLNNDRRLDTLQRYLLSGRLLDVGGGIGTLAAQAIERGFDATNLEPIEEAVRYARDKGIPTIQGTIEDVDASAGRYDVATLMHVLEHLPNSRLSLEAVKNVLVPGGLIMVEVPHYGSMSRRSSKDGWLGWWPGQHIYYYTSATLRRVLEASGFEVVAMRTMVLSFDGLILDHYAYIVGLGPVLQKLLAMKRGRRASFSDQVTEAPPSVALPAPIRDQPLKRRLLLPPLRAIARIEERLGVGETLLAIGRAR